MSRNYLYGIVAEGKVFVEDNLFHPFAHDRLWEKYYPDKKQLHVESNNWLWNYITRTFIAPPGLQFGALGFIELSASNVSPIIQKWIDINLATFEQLKSWLSRNWEGLVRKVDLSSEIHLWRLLQNPISEDFLMNAYLQIYYSWRKASQKVDEALAVKRRIENRWKGITPAKIEEVEQWRKEMKQVREEIEQDREEAYQNWHGNYLMWREATAKQANKYREWMEADPAWRQTRQNYELAEQTLKELELKRNQAAGRGENRIEYLEAKHLYELGEQTKDQTKKIWEEADWAWKSNTLKPIYFNLLNKFIVSIWKK